MLVLLLVLLIQCALVSAFMRCDAAWTAAFAGTHSDSMAGAHFGGAAIRRSAATNGPLEPRGDQRVIGAGGARNKERASPVTMLIGGPSSHSGACAFASGQGQGEGRSAIIWAGAAAATAGGGALSGGHGLSGANPSRRRARSRRSPASPSVAAGSGSGSALHAMAIPARCALPCVQLLRQAYGPRRSFWGDLTAAETRRFYHELLPISVYLDALGSTGAPGGEDVGSRDPDAGFGLATVVEVANNPKDGGGCWGCLFGCAETLEQRARLASGARHAARLYARERCHLPSRVLAHLYDGLRHLKEFGTFRVTGMTWEELWDKYESKILAEDPTLEGEALKTSVCLRILEKSCSTSEVFNNLSGCSDLNNSNNPLLPARAAAAGAPATLAQMQAVESASACSAALRLIPLIKPFRRQARQQQQQQQGRGNDVDEAKLVQKRARRHARRRRMVARRRRRQLQKAERRRGGHGVRTPALARLDGRRGEESS